MSYETVDHPDHYNQHRIECIAVIEEFNYNRGAAIKHVWRAGIKPGSDEIEDLRKAIWYLEREIQRLDNVRNRPERNDMDKINKSSKWYES